MRLKLFSQFFSQIMKPMAKVMILALLCHLPLVTYAKKKDPDIIPVVQTISPSLEATVYGYKKYKYYTAIEIGFTNLSDDYLAFSPKEIYLDETSSFSKPLLTMDQIRDIESRKPGMSLFPMLAGAALGIAALGSLKASENVAYGLGVAAAGFFVSSYFVEAFENRAKDGKFISFDTNSISDIKKIPPGMMLGGTLYFAPAKKPKSVTIMVKKEAGGYEKKVFMIGDLELKK